MACMISSQRLFVPRIKPSVVLERSFVESSCTEAFERIGQAVNNKLT